MTMRELAQLLEQVFARLQHTFNLPVAENPPYRIRDIAMETLILFAKRIADEATAKERERAAMVAEKQYADDGDDMVALAAGLNIAAAIRHRVEGE